MLADVLAKLGQLGQTIDSELAIVTPVPFLKICAMQKPALFVIGVVFAVVLSGCATSAADRSVARIDASSEASAEASYQAMLASLPQGKRNQLLAAVLAINLIGVNSAHEVAKDPSLVTTNVSRIKDRVADMSAEEIIAYAGQNASVQIEVKAN